MSAFAGMHDCEPAVGRGAFSGSRRLRGGLAIRAVSEAGAVQRGLPCEPGARWQMLCARTRAQRGHLCGLELGGFGGPVRGTMSGSVFRSTLHSIIEGANVRDR